MSKVKVRTILQGTWGSSVNTQDGKIEFDSTGLAEVTSEQADYLIGNFSDVYYEDGKKAPTRTESPTPPPVEDFRTKFENGVQEKATNLTPQVPETPSVDVEEIKNKVREELAAEMREALKAEMREEIEAEVRSSIATESASNKVDVESADVDQSSNTSSDVRGELNALNVDEIKGLLKEASVPEKEYKSIKEKEALIDFVLSKEIL